MILFELFDLCIIIFFEKMTGKIFKWKKSIFREANIRFQTYLQI